jgi:predicted nucleotidyltransferase
MIELDPAYLEEIGRILDRHVAGCEVRVFGSRVTGVAHRYSDLDLAILCPEPLAPEIMEALKDAFSESDLPILVDVADWHDLPEGMRNRIEQEHEVIRRKTDSASEG